MYLKIPNAHSLFRTICVAGLTRFSKRSCLILALGMVVGTVWAADEDPRPKRPSGDFQKKLLEEFDADKNGRLDETERAQLRETMAKRLGVSGAPGFDRREILKRFDRDGDGRLNEQERQAAMKASRGAAAFGQRPGGNPAGTPLDRREILKRFDKDGDGKLDETELAAAKASFARRRGPGATRPDAARPAGTRPESATRRGAEFMKRFDKNGDGRIDATERAAVQAAFQGRPGANQRGTTAAKTATAKPDTGRVDKKALLKEFDADGDGKLTGAERASARNAFERRLSEDAKK